METVLRSPAALLAASAQSEVQGTPVRSHSLPESARHLRCRRLLLSHSSSQRVVARRLRTSLVPRAVADKRPSSQTPGSKITIPGVTPEDEFPNEHGQKHSAVDQVNDADSGVDSMAAKGSAAFGLLIVASIAALAGLTYVYKDDVNHAIEFFTTYIEGAGPAGYVAFVFGYAFLEVLAVPAVPLTLSAGLIFGPTVGTVLCSVSATLAATVAFLIARYVARDRILRFVEGNKKFRAIDRAVGDDSFRVVLLLRLSPLLPFSLGNYMYGLTSLQLWPYVFGSCLGMLPGTYAYVSAGAFGRSLLDSESQSFSLSNSSLWALVGGIGVTVAAAAYVTNVAKNAIKDLD